MTLQHGDDSVTCVDALLSRVSGGPQLRRRSGESREGAVRGPGGPERLPAPREAARSAGNRPADRVRRATTVAELPDDPGGARPGLVRIVLGKCVGEGVGGAGGEGAREGGREQGSKGVGEGRFERGVGGGRCTPYS